MVFGLFLATLAKPNDSLRAIIEETLQTTGVPSIAIMVAKNGKVVAQCALGERIKGSKISVTINDTFHIGSCTKSMTALVAAELVKQHKIKYQSTIFQVFPEKPIHEKLKNVSLEDLLFHRSGIKPNLAYEDMSFLMNSTIEPFEQRQFMLNKILPESPQEEPGSQKLYSNLGYGIAGAMLERVTDRRYEALIQERIFKPLGMKSAGFGPPSVRAEDKSQPWGHSEVQGQMIPVTPATNIDNPYAISSAGLVHCNIGDCTKYANFMLNGWLGKDKKWPKSMFDRLISDPYQQEYGHGWIVVQRKWANGLALTHSGSNTNFMTTIWIAPTIGMTYVFMTNAGGTKANEANSLALSAFIKQRSDFGF